MHTQTHMSVLQVVYVDLMLTQIDYKSTNPMFFFLFLKDDLVRIRLLPAKINIKSGMSNVVCGVTAQKSVCVSLCLVTVMITKSAFHD